ncbi:MAG: hypothetical protein DRJ51_06580 [Thermoprotei archaeon]|nr:MAG: hypothetical protein DRJ51_06580 [Thermoprotei archaeon]HDI31689.1 NTPase [Thermofilum sp.]
MLLTGRPGVGKTTCVQRVIDLLKSKGISIGGMISNEERVRGKRVGFKIVDLMTGDTGYLAKAEPSGKPRVGKYRVVIEDLERIGVMAIKRGLERAHVVVIDEIGPMELYSVNFKQIVKNALDSNKPVLATIHYKASNDPYGREVLSRPDVKEFVLTTENRHEMPQKIYNIISRLL